MRDALKRQYEYHQSQAVRRQVTYKLTKGADWDLPPAMLRAEDAIAVQANFAPVWNGNTGRASAGAFGGFGGLLSPRMSLAA